MVAQALANIAPEKIDVLRVEIADMRIRISEETRWLFRYGPKTRTLSLSTEAVEICWAAAHAYATFYDRILVNRRAGQPREVDLTTIPEVHDAMRLLTWAFRKFVGTKREPWPADLPRPVANPPHGSPEHVANELALCAIGFLMHHELAHHRLRHTARTKEQLSSNDQLSSLEQEREADHAAADWVMNAAPSKERNKRLFGIAVGLSLLVAYSIHKGNYDGQDHPRTFDRLIYTLDRSIRDEADHDAWALVAGILALHLQSMNIASPDHAHATFRQLVDGMVEVLASISSSKPY